MCRGFSCFCICSSQETCTFVIVATFYRWVKRLTKVPVQGLVSVKAEIKFEPRSSQPPNIVISISLYHDLWWWQSKCWTLWALLCSVPRTQLLLPQHSSQNRMKSKNGAIAWLEHEFPVPWACIMDPRSIARWPFPSVGSYYILGKNPCGSQYDFYLMDEQTQDKSNTQGLQLIGR